MNKKIDKLVEQMKHEERSREMMRIMLKETDGLMWVKDAEGRYLYANSRLAEELYHTVPESMEGCTDEEMLADFKQKTSMEQSFAPLCALTDKFTMEKGHGCIFLEVGHVGQKEKSLYVIKTPVKGTDGNVIATVGVALNGLRVKDIKVLIEARKKEGAPAEQLEGDYYYLGKVIE